MKKVAILALHLGYGGIEKCIATLANLLVPFYEVEIICTYKLYDAPVFEMDKRIKIRYLLPDRKSNEQEFRKALSKKRLDLALLEGLKATKTLYYRKMTMMKAIKESDADIMIATRDIFDEWLSLYGREGLLKIGWEHNHHHNNEKYARDIVRSCKNLDYLVLVSQDLETFYKKAMKPYHCQCIYIPNVLEKVPSEVSTLSSKHLISVGRLSPEKGYLELVEIAEVLKEKHPTWHLDIVGDGPERERIEKAIKDKNLESFITLHGFQQSDAIYELLSNASIYLMTSYTESFGIVLLEAMSSGLPCIAYDSAEGAREIIQSGYNGYLIKHRNRDAYLKKIEDLMKDEETRKKLGKQARKSIQNFTKDPVQKEWLSLLEGKEKEK